ncbi:MAG: hypothetical protein B6D74_16010 [gamma proteobacterium symbiont of Ctena orbiculata]|nr:MAG: hypothetical protein B6D74_16010 [gamma proteobacterium symbiont of Ctena orbiculata]
MKGNHIAEYRYVDPDTKNPVLLYSDEVHEIYWLGIPEHTAFRSNIYLIKSGEEALIVDPGHQAYFEKTRSRVKQIMDPARVSGLIICHQDPDVAASITQWLQLNPAMQIITSPRTNVLLPYYGASDYRWHNVVDDSSFIFKSGRRIKFIEAPFLHFAGAFTSFDESSGFLLSGDIWAAIQLEWRLIVDDFEQHASVLDLFHLDYMGSNIACRGYVEKLQDYRIDAILPQHGSIIDSANVESALLYLDSLICGTDIIYPHLTNGMPDESESRIMELKQQVKLLKESSQQSDLVRKRYQDSLATLKQKDLELKQKKRRIEKDLEMLKKMQQELVEKEKMAALGTLVAGVAHEVNTPIGVAITSISSCGEALRSIKKRYEAEELSESDMEMFLETAADSMRLTRSSLEQAAKLVSSFKKISVDQNIDDTREIDINEYLLDIIRTFYNQLKKTKIDVDLECPQGLIVRTYPGSLSQILNNLLSNVICHAYEPDENGTVKIKLHKEGGFLHMVFTDLGRGMDATFKELIFQPFTTTARSKGGSGLGLNIVYNLVTQRFGGEISVESEPGKGSRFYLKLAVEEQG